MNFDTHKAVKSLIAAGKFKPEQAEVLVEIIQESKDADLSSMATKGDLIKLEARLREEMSRVKFELLKWVFGINVINIGAVVGLLKLFS